MQEAQHPSSAAPPVFKTAAPSQAWRTLRLLNIYRLGLSGFFTITAFSNLPVKPIGEHHPGLFAITSLIYLTASCINILTINRERPPFAAQVYSHALLDIAAIVLVMHASGGVRSGLGTLMIIVIISGGFLLTDQASIRLAAVATLAMLGEHILFQLNNPLSASAYTHAGLLGATFFATALLAHALGKRLRISEELALKRAADLANMQQLTQYVIQRMRTGVIVTDGADRLRLINESGRNLLGIPPPTDAPQLAQACPSLARQLQAWREDPAYRPRHFKAARGEAELQPRFARLGGESGTVIFLEDITAATQQAQQLKLASLGRLAGGIAHEIRNPLGAISHAGQLLEESPRLNEEDQRLTQIIRTNSDRMNAIIETTLQLGQRPTPSPDQFKLNGWLEEFVAEFCRDSGIPAAMVKLEPSAIAIIVRFDTGQLQQIMWNLCSNGIHHSQKATGRPTLRLKVDADDDRGGRPHIDIMDDGPGVPEAHRDQIFEPFFTTENKGTGLGLYIARELSECNHARLDYLENAEGACFRLTLQPGIEREMQ